MSLTENALKRWCQGSRPLSTHHNCSENRRLTSINEIWLQAGNMKESFAHKGQSTDAPRSFHARNFAHL